MYLRRGEPFKFTVQRREVGDGDGHVGMIRPKLAFAGCNLPLTKWRKSSARQTDADAT